MDTKLFCRKCRKQWNTVFLCLIAMSILLPFFLHQTVSAATWNDSLNMDNTEQMPTVTILISRENNDLPPIPLPGQQKVLRGDADGDGVVNYVDAMLVLRNSVGLVNLSDAAITRCDVDNKKGLSYMDAMLILRYSVGLITQL